MAIRNHEWCGDLGHHGAECFNTLNDKTRTIEKNQWDVERVGMLCGSPEVFADTKKIILQICETTRKCRYFPETNVVKFYNGKKKNKKLTSLHLFKNAEDFQTKIKGPGHE